MRGRRRREPLRRRRAPRNEPCPDHDSLPGLLYLSAVCVLFLPLLRLLIIRAASAPAVPAAAAAVHSAAHLLWPRGLSAVASQSPAGPLHTEQGSVSRYFPWENGQKLDATTTSTGTVCWPRSSDMCILGADMTASPRAPRPAASPASGPRMTSFVQNSFLNGLEAPRECQHTGRATQDGTLRVMAGGVGSAFGRCQKNVSRS